MKEHLRNESCFRQHYSLARNLSTSMGGFADAAAGRDGQNRGRDGRMGREEGWRESDADEKVQWSPNVVAGNDFVQQLLLDCVYLSEWAVGYYKER